MCIDVLVDGKTCGSVGELRAALGCDLIFTADRLECARKLPITDEECLCHVDHDATAASSGLRVDREDCLLWLYVR